MATRVHHVKRTQQRWVNVPVLGEDGQQLRSVITGRTAKSGRPVTIGRTRPDHDQPLPPHDCDYCGEPILPGTPHKWIMPRSGPFMSGRKRLRHEGCPTWHEWEYSSALPARLAEIGHDFRNAIADAEDEDTVTTALADAAERVREIATERHESAEAVEDGFGHETETSANLHQQADDLESWADEIENAQVPGFPEPEETDCEGCEGEGTPGCPVCHGSGTYTPDDPDEDQLQEWRDALDSDLALVGEPPV